MNDDVTRMLAAIGQGDPHAADALILLVYDELKLLAAQRLRREAVGQTLQATDLVHEAFLRLVSDSDATHWNGRGHFFGAAAEAMRRILVERARAKRSLKRGGDRERLAVDAIEPAMPEPDVDLLALNDALDKFERFDLRKASLVKLRFFAGLTIEQAAEALEVSTTTAERDWNYARSWLRIEMQGDGATAP